MASSPQHEPTMEEILASIRKIISEDSNEAAPAASDDVLDLTQELAEETPPPPAPKPEPVRAAAAPARPDTDVVFQSAEPPAPKPAAVASSDDIFSEKTRKAMDDTFAKIPAAVAPAPAPAAAAPVRKPSLDGSSIEAVFERAVSNAFDPVLHQWMDANKTDLLAAVKPLIREWMDEHFPALLEGAVRNEVERVVRSRGK